MATTRQYEEMAAALESVTWAARALAVGEQTIRRGSDTGQLPVIRLGDGTRMFDKMTIQRIAAERAEARAKRAGGDA